MDGDDYLKVKNVSYVGYDDVDQRHAEKHSGNEAKDELRLAWLWVEGWRARLRAGGDVVERSRYV